MINPVKKYIPAFVDAGADILTIHEEINENVEECLRIIKKYGVKAGLSIKPNTPASKLEKYFEILDLILIMTVEPGFGGQSFLHSQLSKISQVREMIGKRAIDLEVDGGINSTTSKLTIKAGANILVAGSSIFKNKNYKENIEILKLI